MGLSRPKARKARDQSFASQFLLTFKEKSLHRRLIAFLVILASALAGQNPRATALSGTVLDSTELGVSGAKVSLSRSNGSGVASTTADGSGAFRFEALAPANYRIVVEHEGFEPANVPVKVAGPTPVQIVVRLKVAALRSEINVSDQATELSTETAENRNTATLNRQALDDLPIFDQDYIGTMSRFLDAGSIATGGVTIIVDGVETDRASVSPSAIQEVKINDDPYSAEYARPGRSRIEIITKPGTSDFHGTFNFLFRDYHLNARDPFALTRPFEQRRIYEGSLTGPLGHSKKTSFLISANRQEEDLQAIVYADGPSGLLNETLPVPSRNTELSGSMNHQFGADQLISIRGLYTDRTVLNQGVGGFNLPETATNFRDREDIIYFNHRGQIAGNFYNFFRFLIARQHTLTTSVDQQPKVVVLGAFTGGGAQADKLQTENHIAFNEIVVWSGKKHTVRFGVNVPDISRRGLDDNTNAGGTYTFSSLADYLARRPFSLVHQSGNGHVVFVEKVLGGFVQDEYKVRPNLQISIGLRYDWQNYFHDNNNVAPRTSFAYSPGKGRKTVIRGGAGTFYDRTGPQPIFDLLRYDGHHLLQYVITNPAYPDPNATGPPSIVTLDPKVKLPYLVQFGAGIERQVAKSTTITVNYYGTRGIDLFRSLDVNAPPPPFYLARPNPQYSVWRQIESSADMKAHSLEVGLRGNITRYFTGMAQYTLARAFNNTGGNPSAGTRSSLNSFPANNYDLSGEWARADFDQRHRFNLLGTITPGRYFKLGIALAFYSGMPYSITTGLDNYNNGTANARPPGVPRNSLQGPGYADLDLRWSRDFYLVKAKKDRGPVATLGLDAFDVMNHVNYQSYVGVLTSPFFGKPVAAQPDRRLQASFRFRF
jgi:hypothetical protein